jgi:hypothetical protein
MDFGGDSERRCCYARRANFGRHDRVVQEPPSMSRAINVDATVAHVTDMCAKHSAPISVIEPLLSGGTRVVLLNAHDTAVVTRAYGAKVMSGPVTRIPSRLRNG